MRGYFEKSVNGFEVDPYLMAFLFLSSQYITVLFIIPMELNKGSELEQEKLILIRQEL